MRRPGHWRGSILLVLLVTAILGPLARSGETEVLVGTTPKQDPRASLVSWAKPPTVRGIYATGWIAGSVRHFANLMGFIDRTQVNSIVIDVKDDEGTLSYRSEVALAHAIGSDRAKIKDPGAMMRILWQHEVWPIARLVVFKDPFLARKRPDLAVRNRTGGLWLDRKGMAWVDPNCRQVWEYNVAVAREAVTKGFREIQFDYVRFTSDGRISDCVYPHGDGRKKEDVIRDFLVYASHELKPLGVAVSADIFGLVTSVEDDLGIGQRLEKIARGVDIISPMVYPSHYAPGSFGLPNPDLRPYETVLRGLTDARKRLDGTGVQIRPWLQDFSLGSYYGRAQVQAQIRAVYDAGLSEWIFWNPSNRYHPEKYWEHSFESVPAPACSPVPNEAPDSPLRRAEAPLLCGRTFAKATALQGIFASLRS